jgi:hypothetical protein
MAARGKNRVFLIQLAEFLQNFIGVISSNPSYTWYILLCFTKWLPKLKIEKPCAAFTVQTAGRISTTLHSSDQYKPCTNPKVILPTHFALLHKMDARAKNEEILSVLHRLNCWHEFVGIHRDQYQP